MNSNSQSEKNETESFSSRPNVLFILSDQHNAKVLGHCGHPDVKTPYLDRLAQEGVQCIHTIVQNPICTPSRVSWLSGQYPHNHGYYGLCGPHPEGLPHILIHLKNYGYQTGAIGKIHCPAYWVEDGCDTFIEVCNCSVEGNEKYLSFLHKRNGMERYVQSERRSDPRGIHQSLEGFASFQSYEESPEGYIVQESIKFMSECSAKGKPFFLHVSFPKPHQVYCPVKEFWDWYPFENLHLPPNSDVDLKHQAPHLIRMVQGYRGAKWTEFDPKTYEAGRLRKYRGYLGNVSQVDYAIGELLNWIRDQKLDENTIVIYSSDHGDYACEFGLIEKAPGICHDAITRVPWIWRWTGHLPAGRMVSSLVESVDFCNTLCHLLNVDPMPTADGQDIVPLLLGEDKEVREVAVTECPWSKSIRAGQWRYVYYPKDMFKEEYPDGFGELYNLEEDPWETHNLYFDERYRTKVQELERKLLDWIIMTTRPKTVLPGISTGDLRYGVTRFRNYVNWDGKIHPNILYSYLKERKINYL